MKKWMMILGVMILAASATYAGGFSALHFTLPRKTVVSGTELAPGDYSVESTNMSGVVVLKFVSSSGTCALAPASILAPAGNPKDVSRLVLSRDGGQYRIDRVWVGDTGYQLIPSPTR